MATTQIEVLFDDFSNRLADLLSQGHLTEYEQLIDNFAFVMQAAASTWQGDGVGNVPSMYDVETRNIEGIKKFMPPSNMFEPVDRSIENGAQATPSASFGAVWPLVPPEEPLGLGGREDSQPVSAEGACDTGAEQSLNTDLQASMLEAEVSQASTENESCDPAEPVAAPDISNEEASGGPDSESSAEPISPSQE